MYRMFYFGVLFSKKLWQYILRNKNKRNILEKIKLNIEYNKKNEITMNRIFVNAG